MIPGISDLAFLNERIGFWATVAIMLTGLIFYAVYRFLSKKTHDFKKLVSRFDETLNLLRLSVLTEEGQVLNQEQQHRLLVKLVDLVEDLRVELNAKIGRHFENVDRLASEEHWKHCDIERCVHLSNLMRAVEHMREYLKDFVEQGKEHRQITQSMISDVFTRLDLFLVEVIKTTNVIRGEKNDSR